MIIARQKKKENIAEYLLYMWQVEDLIRACAFDMNIIDNKLVSRFNVDGTLRKEIYDWYENLCLMMQNEHLEKSGHLQININLVNELNEWHLLFLQSDWQYQAVYKKNIQILADYRMKNSLENAQISDIELSFNLLYITMLMRLQKKEISAATEEAVKSISEMLRMLVVKIKQKEEEDLKQSNE